jgi:hypothetical protein
MKLRNLRDIYKRVCEQRLIYGAQMWGYRGAGKIIMKSKGIFKRKMFTNTKVYLERFGSIEEWNRKKDVEDTIFCCK